MKKVCVCFLFQIYSYKIQADMTWYECWPKWEWPLLNISSMKPVSSTSCVLLWSRSNVFTIDSNESCSVCVCASVLMYTSAHINMGLLFSLHATEKMTLLMTKQGNQTQPANFFVLKPVTVNTASLFWQRQRSSAPSLADNVTAICTHSNFHDKLLIIRCIYKYIISLLILHKDTFYV